MTEVAFHFNVSEKVAYACRILRKATARGTRVVVTGEPVLLDQLDVALWTFSAQEFIAHCRAGADAVTLAASPVLLMESATEAPHHEVLLNLAPTVPEQFGRFERLVEVVSQDGEDRAHARRRWKHYADRGYVIVQHDLARSEAA